MDSPNGKGRSELYIRYRPRTLADVVGQTEAVKVLKGFGVKVPHLLLFAGPSGTGKTTMARIMARQLGCDPDEDNRFDFQEVNCGMVEKPLEAMQKINEKAKSKAVNAPCKVFLLDEFQALSRARFAQESTLKMFEEPPSHVYFMLCTTDPKKILLTIRNRCTDVVLKPLTSKESTELIQRTLKAEHRTLTDRVIEKVVETAEGSARACLVCLEKVLTLTDEREQLASIVRVVDLPEAFDLVKALLPWKGDPSWKDVASNLEKLKDQDPEGLRQMILASARGQLLKMGNSYACRVIKCLRDPYYDKNSGHATLAADCFEAVNGKQK